MSTYFKGFSAIRSELWQLLDKAMLFIRMTLTLDLHKIMTIKVEFKVFKIG